MYKNKYIETNNDIISFPQRKAVINFGSSIVKTFGMINCLAIVIMYKKYK